MALATSRKRSRAAADHAPQSWATHQTGDRRLLSDHRSHMRPRFDGSPVDAAARRKCEVCELAHRFYGLRR